MDAQAAPTFAFVGFATLEGWIEAVDRSRPVLALRLVEPGPGSGGIQVDELLVVCQQVATDGSVLYCRLRAASLTRCYGQPFDPDWREREAAWETLWDAVESTLIDRGFTIQRATVAWPKGYVFLQGRSEDIRFDRVSKTYLRTDPILAEPSAP